MAKRKRKRAQQPEPYPGWVWMLFGLSIGLAVAGAIFVKYRELVNPAPAAVTEPASLASTAADNEAPRPAAVAPPERRFDFYDMLPNFEVIIPEQEPDVSQDTDAQALLEPGIYVLQAGSFSEYSDADRRRAELGLLGIESRIQRVTIDDRTFHRVRIGPTDDLDELNRYRNLLRQSRIDVLRIRLGD